jgi:hypothetical protein
MKTLTLVLTLVAFGFAASLQAGEGCCEKSKSACDGKAKEAQGCKDTAKNESGCPAKKECEKGKDTAGSKKNSDVAKK